MPDSHLPGPSVETVRSTDDLERLIAEHQQATRGPQYIRDRESRYFRGISYPGSDDRPVVAIGLTAVELRQLMETLHSHLLPTDRGGQVILRAIYGKLRREYERHQEAIRDMQDTAMRSQQQVVVDGHIARGPWNPNAGLSAAVIRGTDVSLDGTAGDVASDVDTPPSAAVESTKPEQGRRSRRVVIREPQVEAPPNE